MITKFKTYQLLNESDIYQDFHQDKNRDLNYYKEKIKSGELSDSNLSSLFHWSCVYDFQELADYISDYLNYSELKRLNRSITYLDYDLFKKIIKKDDLYKEFINDKGFYEYIFNNGKGEDKVKKIRLLKKLGAVYNDNLVKTASFYDTDGMVGVLKYFVRLGLEPSKRIPGTFSHAPENCLDVATNYNDGPTIIKYLVNTLNIPVTYRHMANTLSKDNIDGFKILIKSKNRIDDYSYSSWSTHSENKYSYSLSSLLSKMISKNLMSYIKVLIKHDMNKAYQMLQGLPSASNNNESISNKFLNLAYWIIKNYNGNYINSYTTKYITNDHGEFWSKKIEKYPSIIEKLLDINNDIKSSYEYQKAILDADSNNLKYIKDVLNDRIKKEYDFLVDSDKYNL